MISAKPRLAVLVLLLGAGTAGAALSVSQLGRGSPPPTPAGCPDLSHVYSPDRLQVLVACISAVGTIEEIRPEPDGDDHILFRLDPGQEQLLNDGNRRDMRGDLVLEPICEHTVTQADAESACMGVAAVPVPAVGWHGRARGPWVLDRHHGWNEIHPTTFEVAV